MSWWESVVDHPTQRKRDELFYKQVGEVSRLLALVLVGDFHLPDVCWKYDAAERKQSRRFLECVEGNFLRQVVSEPTREGALLGEISFHTGRPKCDSSPEWLWKRLQQQLDC